MTEANFAELLNVNADEIKKPVPLPQGTYSLLIKDFETGESREKKTPFVRYNFNVIGYGSDVDISLLEGVDLSKKSLRSEFYLTADAMFRLVDFLKACGLTTEGQNLRDLVAQSKGLTVNARVIQVPSQKPGDDSIFNNIAGFSAG